MVTTLGYAILGLLARGSHSGYDLAQLLQVKVGAFWQASHSQIYPELARLTTHGLVLHEVIAQTDRPDKKLYVITEAGRAALRAWVDAPLAMTGRRDEFMLKAFSLWLADPQRAITELRTHARQHAAQQAQYERLLIEKCAGAVPPINTPMFSSYLTLHRGVAYEREYTAWCNWAADLIAQQTEH